MARMRALIGSVCATGRSVAVGISGVYLSSLSVVRCPLSIGIIGYGQRTTNGQRPTDNGGRHVTPPLRTASNSYRRAGLRVALALLLPAVVRRAASFRRAAAALLARGGRRPGAPGSPPPR